MIINAYDIKQALISERYRRSFCLPNYTPREWFECDVFELTASGFMREYEIKLSKSDFVADRTKSKNSWQVVDGRFTKTIQHNKHEQLALRWVKGPSRFTFVYPAGLLALTDIPEWAGAIECTQLEGYTPPARVRLRVVRPAPQLHRSKACPSIRDHARSVCYWRYLSLLLHQPAKEPA